MTKKEEVGQRIRMFRLSAGMTQAELARKLHQSTSSITMYETGKRAPDFETLEAIADTFNVPMAMLVGPEASYESVLDDPMLIQVHTTEARILAKGFDRMPAAERKRAVDMAKLIFEKYADLFEQKGNDDDA